MSTDATLLNGVVFQIEAGPATQPLNSVSSGLATQYKQAMGSPYYSFVSNDYSAVEILATALKQAGTFTNTTQIISALQTASFTGPTGTVQFNSQHDWIPNFWYTQFQSGKEEVISPSGFAQASYNATA